jgi:nicotinate dehydrogenase subunit B
VRSGNAISRRSFLAAGGVLIVGLGFDGVVRAQAQTVPGADRFLGKSLAPDAVDSFLAVHADGSVTIFVGKVDIGTGGRIAMRQIVGEELDVPLERIAMIEGDTALTPNQGATAGSYGIARGGTQLRQAAATARQALLAQAAQRLGRPVGDLQIVDGIVRAKDGSAAVTYGELIGNRAFNLKVDGGAPLKAPHSFRFIGKSLPHPDIPAKVTGRHRYLHDLTLPGMLHARVIRPPALGAGLVSVDESSIAAIGGSRVVRIQNFLAVVAEREWDAVRAARCVQSQLEGNIIQTLSRTLHEEIVYDGNGVTTVDWTSYPILTFPEVPALEFELIQRLDQPPLGVGEAASTPVPAALGNAVFDATAVRLRTVPFRADRVKAALARS